MKLDSFGEQTKMGIKLAQRAYNAFKLVNDTSFKPRAKRLALIHERGLALILYWNQIETALKLIRYYDRIKDDWPNELSFIRTSWKPLRELKGSDPAKYDLILSGSYKSLWKIRNGIAHEGCNVTTAEYSKYIEAALWVILELNKKTPNLERLRDKKRRSDAQLKEP